MQLAALTRRMEALTATPSTRVQAGAPKVTPPKPTSFDQRRTLEASCASLAAEAVKVKAMSRSKAKELWVP